VTQQGHGSWREPRSKGKFLGVVLGSVGKGVLSKAFVNSVQAIEARNGAPTPERV
jgi:hypothetical protein